MILFIDTHDSLITIAIKTKDNVFINQKESEFSHSIYVMPMIKSIFEDNKLNINDLSEILVVNGPGSFTGIRIGLTIAKTIAYSLNIKIKTISSLTAYLVSYNTINNKMCIIDDNKGYYQGVFDKDNNSVVDEFYSDEIKYNYEIVPHELDVNKIFDYAKKIDSENYHHVAANYVKKIEVEK